jgi:hypothetical protein
MGTKRWLSDNDIRSSLVAVVNHSLMKMLMATLYPSQATYCFDVFQNIVNEKE